MRFKTWPVAALGLGLLLVLVVLSMLMLSRKAQALYAELDELNAHHHNFDVKLRGLRSDVNLSAIFIRDYLLDVEPQHGSGYRERLADLRQTNLAGVEELKSLDRSQADRIAKLETQLDEYWRTFEPLFDWSASQKLSRSASFLRREVIPKREAVVAIAWEIEQLNNANLETQRGEVTRRQAVFRQDLTRLLWQTMFVGVLVAVVATIRLRALEQRADQQRTAAEEAERQTRLLSQRLVEAQETERKNLSRELHDQVAQVLTALRMELGRIERTKPVADSRVALAVIEARRLVDQMFRTVRDLTLGLRPSMIDDFGLQPALEWHVRHLSQRFGVSVDLEMKGDFESLPERHRICLYRSVQEALTNCMRHAKAHSIHVAVVGLEDRVEAAIRDDGIGFDPNRRRDGFGLRGIEERARELAGTMTINAGSGTGTIVRISLPLDRAALEISRARAAG